MRSFELVLWLLAVAWAVWQVLRSARETTVSRWLGVGLPALSGAALALHLSLEGARFHLSPLYLLLGLLFGLRLAARRLVGWRRWAVAAPLLFLALLGAALANLFPVYRYQAPSGAFPVGTADYLLPGRSPGRDLVVQVWYPAAAGATGRLAGLSARPEELARAYSSLTGLPSALFDHLRLVKTHAVVEAPLAAGSHPVVLFSHGPIAANRSQSLFQMEELASHGFVVAAIDHTGYASSTLFPDGHAVPAYPEARWPMRVDADSQAMVETWVGDVRFVIDRLEALNAQDPRLAGRLDLSRIGYLGASFGGSVVVQALLEEPRLSAGIAQDGKPYFFDQTLSRLERPLLYMQSSKPYLDASDEQLASWGADRGQFQLAHQDHVARQMLLFASARGPMYNLFIGGTDHLSFSDLYLLLGVPDFQRLNVRRGHRIINDYSLAFFSRYLGGSDEPLLDPSRSGPYPEVVLATRNVRSVAVARE